MKGNSTEYKILKYIYLTVLPIKSLMRSIGYSYDSSGRIVSRLIKRGYIKELTIDGTKILHITDIGLNEIKKHNDFDENFYKTSQARIKGIDGKRRQIRLSSVLQILNSYLPNSTSVLTTQQPTQSTTTYRRSDKIKNIQKEISRRSEAGNWYISTREMREIDETGLKNIASPRALGILHLSEVGDFVTYNHYGKRMKMYGSFDIKYKMFAEELLKKPINGSLHFGRSYKIMLDSLLKTNSKLRSVCLLSSMIYDKQYFIPLTNEGKKQLEIYTVKNFREKIRSALIKSSERELAIGSIYDGIKSNGDLIYIGFECEYNSIESLLEQESYRKTENKLAIYCFPHQALFYETVFKGRCKISIIKTEDIVEYLNS